MRTRPESAPEPEDAPGFVNRGNGYSRNGVYDRAIEAYTKAVTLDPELADAYFNRGVSYYELGEYRLAIDDLTKAIQLNPNDDNYYGRRLPGLPLRR